MKSINKIIKKSMVILMLGFALFFLFGCSATTSTDTDETPFLPDIENVREYHDILVVAPASSLEVASEAELDDIDEMIRGAQEYFDDTMLDFSQTTVYFIPLRGEYTHANEEMEIIGALVNRLEVPINSVSGRIRLLTDTEGIQIATITFDLTPEFMGILQPDEALLLSLTAPVRGLEENQIFEAFQFVSELIDLTFIEADNY